MCHLCEQARRGPLTPSRRGFLRSMGAIGALAGLPAFLAPARAIAQTVAAPTGTGTPGRRTLIRGGAVLSMDADVGNFARADVLVEGKLIMAIGPDLDAGDAAVIDAGGMIVMPGFIDTHHHQFQTALRSFLADALLFNDGQPHGALNYVDTVMGQFAPVYRPEDVYISELLGSLSQLDAGVTTVHDISQIHSTPAHTDAVVQALTDAGRRAVMGYVGAPASVMAEARRLMAGPFATADQLLTLSMVGEIGQPGQAEAWAAGRELGLQVVSHVVGSFGAGAAFDAMGAAGDFGPDCLFIHMTGMSDAGWQAVRDAGAAISLAVPIEMTMRHGMPPILKTIAMGMQPSLSTDVECTMTADFFTQMRATLTLQRALVNEQALSGASDLPALLTSLDVIRFATLEGARALRLDAKVGSLAPGKEADILLLDATDINVAPLNHVPGAVVTLMERSNVDTVMVAGRIRKWQGDLLDVDIPKLVTEIDASRDYLFKTAGVDRDLFRL